MKRRKHTVKRVKRSAIARKESVKDSLLVKEFWREGQRKKANVLHALAHALDVPVLRLGDDAPELVRDLATSPAPQARLLGALLGAVTGDVRGNRILAGEGLQEGGGLQEGPQEGHTPQEGPDPSQPSQDGAVRVVLREDGMAEWTTPTGQVVVAPVTRPGEDWRKGVTKATPGIWDTPEAKAYLETLRSDGEDG